MIVLSRTLVDSQSVNPQLVGIPTQDNCNSFNSPKTFKIIVGNNIVRANGLLLRMEWLKESFELPFSLTANSSGYF